MLQFSCIGGWFSHTCCVFLNWFFFIYHRWCLREWCRLFKESAWSIWFLYAWFGRRIRRNRWFYWYILYRDWVIHTLRLRNTYVRFFNSRFNRFDSKINWLSFLANIFNKSLFSNRSTFRKDLKFTFIYKYSSFLNKILNNVKHISVWV